MASHTCPVSTWEVVTEESGVQSQLIPTWDSVSNFFILIFVNSHIEKVRVTSENNFNSFINIYTLLFQPVITVKINNKLFYILIVSVCVPTHSTLQHKMTSFQGLSDRMWVLVTDVTSTGLDNKGHFKKKWLRAGEGGGPRRGVWGDLWPAFWFQSNFDEDEMEDTGDPGESRDFFLHLSSHAYPHISYLDHFCCFQMGPTSFL